MTRYVGGVELRTLKRKLPNASRRGDLTVAIVTQLSDKQHQACDYFPITLRLSVAL